MKDRLSVTVEKTTITKIDNSKGRNEPRSRFIEDIILEFLEKKRGSHA